MIDHHGTASILSVSTPIEDCLCMLMNLMQLLRFALLCCRLLAHPCLSYILLCPLVSALARSKRLFSSAVNAAYSPACSFILILQGSKDQCGYSNATIQPQPNSKIQWMVKFSRNKTNPRRRNRHAQNPNRILIYMQSLFNQSNPPLTH